MPDGSRLDAPSISLRDLVHGVALTLMVGWILFLGRGIFVPMVSALLIVYIVIGVSKLTTALPWIGPRVPLRVHYFLAAVAIGYALIEMVAVFSANLAAIAAQAPRFQFAILALIQDAAARFGVEGTLTWATIRRDLLGEINLQSIARTTLTSAATMLTGLFFVLLNVAFMMMEQRSFYTKLGRLSNDPTRVARILDVVTDINARVGRYLAVKTLINVALGVLSYAIMTLAGLEFAVFWAIVIGLLNYIPYIGSFVGVAFPVALSIVQFGEFDQVVALALALTAAQVLMGNVIEPQVMGTSLNLSPYVILVSLTAWSSLWGVAGALFSVPITAVMVIVFSEFPGSRPIAVLLSKNGDVAPRGGA
ncbi:MAG: AI-2E family transporter [Rhodobacteraceae bacterium]|nr:MAG: AI-2E family transporter [Paracoccaceae bacterium]